MVKNRFHLFFNGFVYVLLVAINMFQIAHEKYLGVLIVGFLIGLVWTANVKKISIGSNTDRFIYALGAGIGSLAGLFISKMIYK